MMLICPSLEHWNKVTIHRLTQNMRTETGAIQFADWLLQIGKGEHHADDEYNITLPQEMCLKRNESLEFVYGGMNQDNVLQFKSNVILTLWNLRAEEINQHVLSQFTSPHRTYYSADEATLPEQGIPDRHGLYPLEFLHSLNPSGFPPVNCS